MAAGLSSAAGGRELRCRSPRVRALLPVGASSAATTRGSKLRPSWWQAPSAQAPPLARAAVVLELVAGEEGGERALLPVGVAVGGRGSEERHWREGRGGTHEMASAERVATCAERAGGDCEQDSWATSMERLLDHRFFVFSSNLPIHIFLQMLELF